MVVTEPQGTPQEGSHGVLSAQGLSQHVADIEALMEHSPETQARAPANGRVWVARRWFWCVYFLFWLTHGHLFSCCWFFFVRVSFVAVDSQIQAFSLRSFRSHREHDLMRTREVILAGLKGKHMDSCSVAFFFRVVEGKPNGNPTIFRPSLIRLCFVQNHLKNGW